MIAKNGGRRYLLLLAPFVPFLVAAVVVALKLPPDAQYVGTDIGFSFAAPGKHIFDLTWYAWNWYGAGSINLYNLSVAPFYAFVELFHLARMSAVQISHAMEVIQFGGIGLGAYVLSATVVGSARLRDVATSLVVGLFAMFNYFGALMLLVPASLYQPAFIAWPLLIAWEIRLLRARRPFAEVSVFAFAVFVVLSLNLAHTVVAVSLALALAVATAISTKSWTQTMRVGGMVAAVVAVLSMPFWASIVVYHAIGGTPLIASANLTRFDSLIDHVRASHGLSSFAGLLRLNTIVWWPALEQAKAWGNPLVILSTFALSGLAIAGILSARFDFFTRKFWGIVFLVSLFLAKGIHAPFGEYYARFLTLPMAVMLREANDKFILVVYVAVIILASIGLRSIQTRFPRVLVTSALLFSALPFFLGQPFLDGFIVRMPSDYARVGDLLRNDPDARVFSVAPSNLNEQGSTLWFHGSNLDDALFRNPVTYSTTYQTMGLSSAPVYGDDRLVGAQEYFADRQVGKILGIRYILVHKDFTQGFDIGFSRTQDIHVNGQREAEAVLQQCEKDDDLELLFDGPYLRLYRVRDAASPLTAVSQLHAVRGYGNALFPLLESSPSNRGFVFSGTQQPNMLDGVAADRYVDRILTFVQPPTDLLTSDQILGSPDLESSIGDAFGRLPVPQTSVGAMPPGDYFVGFRSTDTVALHFPISHATRDPMSTFYRHRAGYSAIESDGLKLVTATPPPAGEDIGLADPDVQSVITSKDLVSRAVDAHFPLAGAVRVFLSLSGTLVTFSDPAAVEFTIESDARRWNLWMPIGDWGVQASATTDQTLLGALNLPDARAIGTLDLDVMSTVVKKSHETGGSALNRPGLRIVRARLFLSRAARERFASPPIASIRLYDAGPDDYGSQSTLASVQRVSAISVSGSNARALPVWDVPGALLLTTPPVNKDTTISAIYRYSSWKAGQLVLIGHGLLQPSGPVSVAVTYAYGGRHFTKNGVSVSVSREREPYGLLPLQLDDPGSASQTEFTDWTHFTIDLRSILPDMRRSVVERVVVSIKLDSDSGGPATFALGPLEGYDDEASRYPLTELAVDGKVVHPTNVMRLGTNASVDFAAASAAPPNLTVTTGPAQGNVPSAIRVGAPIAPNPVIAKGKLVDPTLGTVAISSAGVVELGTMFNQGWVLRRGAPRPFGVFRELGAWLSTEPLVAPHFVSDSFANAWIVPAGTYTVVFVPQVVRDLSVLCLPAVCLFAILAGLLLGLAVRAKRASA